MGGKKHVYYSYFETRIKRVVNDELLIHFSHPEGEKNTTHLLLYIYHCLETGSLSFIVLNVHIS